MQKEVHKIDAHSSKAEQLVAAVQETRDPINTTSSSTSTPSPTSSSARGVKMYFPSRLRRLLGSTSRPWLPHAQRLPGIAVVRAALQYKAPGDRDIPPTARTRATSPHPRTRFLGVPRHLEKAWATTHDQQIVSSSSRS